MEEFFWEDFFERNYLFTLLKSAKLFESKGLMLLSRFCLNARRKEGRKISILRSASASISHLKIESKSCLGFSFRQSSVGNHG